MIWMDVKRDGQVGRGRSHDHGKQHGDGRQCTSWCRRQTPPPLTNCQSHGSAVRTATRPMKPKKKVREGETDRGGGRWRTGGVGVFEGNTEREGASRKQGEGGRERVREEEKTNRAETDVISCQRPDGEDVMLAR